MLSIFSSWSTEGLWVFKIIAADAVVLSHACCEARQMSENSLTCQVDKQLTSLYREGRRVKATKVESLNRFTIKLLYQGKQRDRHGSY